MTYLIMVKDESAEEGFVLYGEEDGGYFIDVQDAEEVANDYFPDQEWKIVPVNRTGTIGVSR